MRTAIPKNAENKSRLINKIVDKQDSISENVKTSYPSIAGVFFDFAKIRILDSNIPLRVQPKLIINRPGDQYEQEADAMAEKVMRMPQKNAAVRLQRKADSDIQRKCAACEEEKKEAPIMRKAEGSGGMEASPVIASAIANTRGGGSALPGHTRSFMEYGFGKDFSQVRIHADGQAAEMNQGIQAKAFTTGNDIYFNRGQYDPYSGEGRKLLAHELTHTLQQRGRKMLQREITEHTEREYSTHAQAYARGPVPEHLGDSVGGLSIEAFTFQGTTNNQALVIAGVHGSELSGVEVVEALIQQLRRGPRPYYTVTLVPRLFPDNIRTREQNPSAIRADNNIGRYSGTGSVDPNRQMPELGRPFNPAAPVDSMNRAIEPENVMLLELINRTRPTRIVSVHAMHSDQAAGIFADPRTDQNQVAMGYDTDRDLALEMARLAQSRGAAVSGNHLGESNPNTTYALDPPIAAVGQTQQRSRGQSGRGRGVSLGGWASTAVCDAAHPDRNRSAMRIITIEMPRGQRSQDMRTEVQRTARASVVQAHVDAIREIFLGNHQVESNTPPNCP